ncbi:peptide deformylase [Desulfofarcimen acetoxidans DSM 771]|uniref:Peptide deformylase n=1 Tax=Desulfofarcimen acetoxidans (strain ATCC 49208 / DSM 771 / KCTC 5769 / VKM B-1644 / 5575) TaxID=485916 RepID=C8W072_DESAS|nr:peptide deformylase [Desulfofarcimen acetoxidans]ACV63127.1 peptide deformylase [Desulfofarcimen acetoxidans DSM 771]
MAIYNIVEVGDPVLRQKANPVKNINSSIHKLLKNMADTMYDAKGVGLAAPQIGISKRVVVVDIGEGLLELINPRIIKASGQETDTEGCLSIPGTLGQVPRASKIQVQALNRNGEQVEYHVKGFMARAVQHELDHLDGILFIDKAESLRKQFEDVVLENKAKAKG